MRTRNLAGALVLLAATQVVACMYPSYTFDLEENGQSDSGGGGGGTGGTGGSAGTEEDASDAADSSDHDGGSQEADVSVEADAADEDVSVESGDEDAPDEAQDDVVSEDAATDPTTDPTLDPTTDPVADQDASDAADAGDADADAPDVVDAADADAADAADADAGDGCATVTENCTNGKDDNCDGLIDCADPECGAYACTPKPPVGWIGPIQLYDGIGTNPLPACPAAAPTKVADLGNQLVAPTASCSTCSCSAYSGVTCSLPLATAYNDTACAGTNTCSWSGIDFSPPGTCIGGTFPACSTAPVEPVAIKVGTAAATGGTCTASPQFPSIPSADWGEKGRLCQEATFGGGCTGTDMCAATPAGQFQPKLCIYSLAGTVNCPSGAYTQKHWLYQSWTDSRGCTSCTCGSPQNVQCPGNVQVYTETSACTTIEETIPNGTCGTITPPANGTTPKAMKYVAGAPTGGGCASGGGQPNGTASPNLGWTVCCLP